MARSRNIKPAFFTNDVLADIEPLGRLLFIGLWTLADRQGRLEDRHRRIKAEVLPYDDADVDGLLDALQKRDFIQRYGVGEERFIQITNFNKHQNPHVKEASSTIPAPGQHHTSTVPVSCDASPLPERAGLIPDSGFLIPDSTTSKEVVVVIEADDAIVSLDRNANPDCPHQEIIALYHEMLPTGTQVRVWNGARRKHLQARWREAGERQSLDWWRRFFTYCADSEFLTGRVTARDGREPFVVGLDWLVSPQNFAKTIEGKYHRSAA